MTILPTWQAQRCIIASEWLTRTETQQRLWLALMTACQSPGIPLDEANILAQLATIWGGAESTTYQLLLAET